jgi:hypothetical protein
MKFAVSGSELAEMVTDFCEVCPSFCTVSVTVYEPVEVYVCTGLFSTEVVPSPKSQK